MNNIRYIKKLINLNSFNVNFQLSVHELAFIMTQRITHVSRAVRTLTVHRDMTSAFPVLKEPFHRWDLNQAACAAGFLH